MYSQESRKLKFWYVDGTDYYNQVTTAYEFFKELVRPENFPRGELNLLPFVYMTLVSLKRYEFYFQSHVQKFLLG